MRRKATGGAFGRSRWRRQEDIEALTRLPLSQPQIVVMELDDDMLLVKDGEGGHRLTRNLIIVHALEAVLATQHGYRALVELAASSAEPGDDKIDGEIRDVARRLLSTAREAAR